MTALYQLASQFRELEALGADELDEETLRTTLEGLEGELTLKATNIALFSQNLEALAEMTGDAAQKLKARADRLKSRADALKQYLFIHLQAAGVRKIEAPEFTISIKKNPPSVDIDPLATIPDQYLIPPEPQLPKPDKQAISRALKAGKAVNGCRLIQLERLDIRA